MATPIDVHIHISVVFVAIDKIVAASSRGGQWLPHRRFVALGHTSNLNSYWSYSPKLVNSVSPDVFLWCLPAFDFNWVTTWPKRLKANLHVCKSAVYSRPIQQLTNSKLNKHSADPLVGSFGIALRFIPWVGDSIFTNARFKIIV